MVKLNLLANYAGNIWLAAANLVFVPFYIHFMGAESYGLIGVYTSLQAMFLILDLGLSQTINRELALLSVDRKGSGLMADTVRTLEIIYLGIALAVTLTLILLADFIANHWLNPIDVTRQSLTDVLIVMAINVGLRFPVVFYTAGLNGLQRQIATNATLVFFTTLLGVGAIVVLWAIAPTPLAFFAWQALVTLFQALALKIIISRSLSTERKGSFDFSVIKRTKGFSAGMFGTTALGIVITQLDKVFLSKYLSLADFGYYSLAITAASVISAIRVPILNAYSPRFTELVAKGDKSLLSHNYHQGCQLMSLLVIPFGVTVVFFSHELLGLWIRNADVVIQIAGLTSLLIIGNVINSLLTLPYMMQLAHGWTKLGFYTHVIDLILFVPLIFYLTTSFGSLGGAISWLLFNLAHFIFIAPIMHRRILTTELKRWYINDIGKLLLIAICVITSGRFLLSVQTKSTPNIFIIGMMFGVVMIAVSTAAETLRKPIIANILAIFHACSKLVGVNNKHGR